MSSHSRQTDKTSKKTLIEDGAKIMCNFFEVTTYNLWKEVKPFSPIRKLINALLFHWTLPQFSVDNSVTTLFKRLNACVCSDLRSDLIFYAFHRDNLPSPKIYHGPGRKSFEKQKTKADFNLVLWIYFHR